MFGFTSRFKEHKLKKERRANMDTQLIAASNNNFCINLFKKIFEDKSKENVFISPFSISAAVAMTHLGAKEATAQGIEKALCWGPSSGENKNHKEFQTYITKLQTPNDNFSLSTANRIYMQKNYTILEEFKTKTKSLYLAEPVLADFVNNAESERSEINAWVAEQTQDKIKDLIASGVLNALTRMVLVNAIYFKGNWDQQFDVERTHPKPFKLAPDHTKSVPTMHTKKKYSVIENRDLECRAIEIPYKNKDLSMVVILPQEDFGLQNLITNLNQERLGCLLSDLEGSMMEEINLALPKFEVTSSHGLKETLSALGMSDAFSADKADFSGITGKRDLVISDAIHKAFIKVNEEGTEAAAATAVVMMLRCALPEMPFTVDHPFLYLIKDNRANGLILFIGAVVDPSSQ